MCGGTFHLAAYHFFYAVNGGSDSGLWVSTFNIQWGASWSYETRVSLEFIYHYDGYPETMDMGENGGYLATKNGCGRGKDPPERLMVDPKIKW